MWRIRGKNHKNRLKACEVGIALFCLLLDLTQLDCRCCCRVCISWRLQQLRSEVISAVIVSATNYSARFRSNIRNHMRDEREWKKEKKKNSENFLSSSCHHVELILPSRRKVFGHFVCDMNFSFDSSSNSPVLSSTVDTSPMKPIAVSFPMKSEITFECKIV